MGREGKGEKREKKNCGDCSGTLFCRLQRKEPEDSSEEEASK